jgi:multimeric flavodoxin WrbA
MKILLLNGNPRKEIDEFNDWLLQLKKSLLSDNHSVKQINVVEKNIVPCVGCWKCWVKYPGICFNHDDSHEICRYVINAGLVIFASPLIMGFISAQLKSAIDKMIPLILPFIEIYNEEMHHKNRYEKYPRIAGVFGLGDKHDQEDFDIATGILKRNALNMKTELMFTVHTESKIQDVVDEINHI